LLEIANKLDVSIGHHSFGQPMQLDIFKEQDNYSRRI